jgi:hypothetical protein
VNLSWLNDLKCCEDVRDQWEQVFQGITRRNQDDDTERRSRQILLELEVLISRDERFKPVRGGLTQ